MVQHEAWTVPPGFRIADGRGGSSAPLTIVGTPAVGDVPTFDGTKFVPQAPSGLPLLVIADFLGGGLLDTDPHNFAFNLATAAVVVGAWTLDVHGDLVAPVAGVYECIFTTQVPRHATAPNEVTFAVNSATSDTELGPVLVVAAPAASAAAVYADARTFTTGVLAGQSFGTLQLTQTNAAAAAAGLAAFAQLSIRCLAAA